MANFFEKQRDVLKLNRTEMAARLHTTAETVRLVEVEGQHFARIPIADIAAAYEITEQKAGEEVMAIRRRIEARRGRAALASK